MTFDRKWPDAKWKIGSLENVFPVFVAEIRAAGKKIRFLSTIRSAKPPVLHVRVRETDAGETGPFKFVRLIGKLVEQNFVEHSDKEEDRQETFEQLEFLLDNIGDDEMVDFIGIGNDDGDGDDDGDDDDDGCSDARIEMRSFEIELV